MPFHCDDPRTDRWAMETLDEIYPMAAGATTRSNDVQKKQHLNHLVELVPAVHYFRANQGPTTDDFIDPEYHQGRGGSSQLPSWSTDSRLRFQHLTIEMLTWQNQNVLKLRLPTEHQMKSNGYLYAWLFDAPIIDTPRMLQHMLEEIDQNEKSDVNVETGVYYESVEHLVEDAKSLGCDTVVNCTGLGARELCEDNDLVGARGILHHYSRTNCVRTESVAMGDFGEMTQDAVIMMQDSPFASETHPVYMIPRGDTIVVGGTYLEGDYEVKIKDDERERLFENAQLLGIDTEASERIGEWVGFRPYRPTSRCEIDTDVSSVKLIHSYGYGGSGWTVYTGAAKEAADLITGVIR